MSRDDHKQRQRAGEFMILRATVILAALSIGTAMADPFDPPSLGGWTCPNGATGIHEECKPPELGQVWWLACVPGRTDCMMSGTAFLGWRSDKGPTKAVRGPGYCYTQHLFTCIPSGKWP